jgi:cytochrome c nitrite reductase small subunit
MRLIVRDRRWRMPAAVALVTALLGSLVGLGAFTFGYGKGYSYLGNNPNSCANCHVMQEHLESWQHSSHQHVAVCNDCHLPQGLFGKYLTKLDNGFFHSVAFTLENYPEPIQIKPRNARVTQASCLGCHGDFVHSLATISHSQKQLECAHCHREVGHAHR